MDIPDQINAYQTELIQKWAKEGPCVIVGRCADYLLHDSAACFRVFICGELKDRANRVIQEYEIDEKNAEAHIKERDKKRARYYKHVTDLTWGMAENYDLCLNSSMLGVDRCVEIIMQA